MDLRVKQSFHKESKLLSDEVLKITEHKPRATSVFKNASLQAKTMETGPGET